MGIQTSQITTSSDGDLSLNPDGTGKVVLPDLSGSGEVPMAVDTDGKVKPLDEREFTELSAIDPGDNIMVQRGTGYYRIDATNLGGLGLADPNPPTDITWYPSTPPGSGTQLDPYVLTSATVYMPGGTATSVESCQIVNQKPDSLVLISEVGGKVGVRMDQPGQICDNDGKTLPFNFGYVDAPDTTSGQDYDGLMRIGQSSIYVKWVVTQVVTNTNFGPISAPNASPTTVNYAADGKYGTVTGTWADGDQTLTASNMVFSVNGGTMDSSSKSISDGDRIAIGFLDSAVAAASEGDTITGILSGPTYYSEISMVKNTVPAPFTIQPRADQSPSAETTTGNEPIKGVNAPTTISAAGSSANQLTSVGASINGGGAVSSGTFNPGDSLQGFGTTGASNNTTYQATFTVGGVSSTWDVSTSTVAATIGQPIITSPANGSADLVPDVVLTGSAYDSQGAGAHSATTWEVYEAGAGSSVSPSISTTDGESPLTLSGPAPGGLRDKVVMVDSTSPTVEGGETQPTPYTLTTSTIANVLSEDGEWASGSGWIWLYGVREIPELGKTFFSGNNGLAVAVGSNYNTQTTANATISRVRDFAYSPTLNIITGIGSSADGSLADAHVYSADQGATWNTHSTVVSASQNYREVIWRSDINKFIAAGESGFATSTDGINWANSTTDAGSIQCQRGLAHSSTLGTFAIASSGTSGGQSRVFKYNSSSALWEQQTGGNAAAMTADTQWFGMTYADGFGFVAVSYSNNSRIIYSADGLTWTEATNPDTNIGFIDVEYRNGKFLAVGIDLVNSLSGPQMVTSSDGINWEVSPIRYSELPIDYTNGGVISTSYGFLAFGQGGVGFAVSGSGTGISATTLTFASPNPDLKYFRPGDVVQSLQSWRFGEWVSMGTGTPYRASDDWDNTFNGRAEGTGSVGQSGATFPESDGTMTFTPVGGIPVNSTISFYILNATDKSTYGCRINGTTWLDATADYNTPVTLTAAQVGGALTKVELINTSVTGCYMSAIEIDGEFLVDSTALADPQEFVKVLTTDVANNKMVVDGGTWSGSDGTSSGDLWNQSQVWSGQWSGTFFDGYSAEGMFTVDGGSGESALAAANSTITWTPVGVTFSDELVVYAQTTGTAGGSIVANFQDGTTKTVLTENTPSTGGYNPYVLKTGGGTLTSFTQSTGSSATKAFIMSEWRADGKLLIDAGQTGAPVGATDAKTDITGEGEVAATNGAQVTLTNVEGRWVGSGSENKAGKTFYAATVAQTGAPGAPSDPVDTGKYTAITPSATTLTTATLDDSNLTPGKFYYSRVKYGDGSIESDFSEYNEFGTKASFVPDVGGELSGGYFAGQINDAGIIYNLIVAPLTSGLLNGQYGGSTAAKIQWKTEDSGEHGADHIVRNLVYGGETTGYLGAQFNSLASSRWPAFWWTWQDPSGPNAGVADLTGASNGTGIGGFNDWYIPAKYELEICYRSLKPTTDVNNAGSGPNPNAVPPTLGYTLSDPAQTDVLDFRDGGGQAFDSTGGNQVYYTATETGAASRVWTISFKNGDEEEYNKKDERFLRCVRREAA